MLFCDRSQPDATEEPVPMLDAATLALDRALLFAAAAHRKVDLCELVEVGGLLHRTQAFVAPLLPQVLQLDLGLRSSVDIFEWDAPWRFLSTTFDRDDHPCIETPVSHLQTANLPASRVFYLMKVPLPDACVVLLVRQRIHSIE